MLSARVCFIPLRNVEICTSMQLLAYNFNSVKFTYYFKCGMYIALGLTFSTIMMTAFWGVFLMPHIWWGLFTLAEETQIVPILMLLWGLFSWLFSRCSFQAYGDSRYWLKSILKHRGFLSQCLEFCVCMYVHVHVCPYFFSQNCFNPYYV